MSTPQSHIPHPSFLQKVLFNIFGNVIEYWKTSETPEERLFRPAILHNYKPEPKPAIVIYPPEDDPHRDLGYLHHRRRRNND